MDQIILAIMCSRSKSHHQIELEEGLGVFSPAHVMTGAVGDSSSASSLTGKLMINLAMKERSTGLSSNIGLGELNRGKSQTRGTEAMGESDPYKYNSRKNSSKGSNRH